MAHDEKKFKIIVNASEHTVTHEVLSFDDMVALAFPGQANDPNVAFSVTFEHAASKPHQGSLAKGGTVTVKNNTVFDVTQTNRS